MARPVVGGHFAFLALERACGGRAVEGLKFLDQRQANTGIDVAAALLRDSALGNEEEPWGLGDMVQQQTGDL